jgi:hypothetical protein
MIFARSPFIITIDETPQESTRLELFLWNGTGAAPAAPTYSLSKKVPSVNNNATYYNIAPFIREFFDFTQSSPIATGMTANTNDYAYCNVIYKTYYTLDGTETLLNTVTDVAFDGFGYFEDDYNYQGQNVLLSQLRGFGGGNVYYYDCDNESNAGIVTLYTQATVLNTWIARYTNLSTGTVQNVTLTNNRVVDISRVYTGWNAVGNTLRIIKTVGPVETIVVTFAFVPQCECKYDVINVDFVNRWGAWQREFFYKASTESVEMTNNQFKSNPVPFPNYNLTQPQYKTFNTNGKRTYKLNTGWVNENYKQVIEEMLLSEMIRVDGLPANLKTKSIEKFKSINTKTINYTMEFEMAYDIINSIS